MFDRSGMALMSRRAKAAERSRFVEAVDANANCRGRRLIRDSSSPSRLT